MKKLKYAQIPRRLILSQIGNCFQGMMQWSKRIEWTEHVTKYYHRATSLIELLEIFDCGSVGGFDKGQPPPQDLFDRWDWLLRKEENPEGRRFGCSIASYEDIRNFFKKSKNEDKNLGS